MNFKLCLMVLLLISTFATVNVQARVRKAAVETSLALSKEDAALLKQMILLMKQADAIKLGRKSKRKSLSPEELKGIKEQLATLYRQIFTLKVTLPKESFNLVEKVVSSFNAEQQEKFLTALVEELDHKK